MSELHPPAETYRLNVVASGLGRMGIEGVDPETVQQTSELLHSVVDAMQQSDIPPVPHHEPELLREAIKFDDKLLSQVAEGPASRLLDPSLASQIEMLISAHRTYCETALRGDSDTGVVDMQTVANSFGLPDLWKDVESLVTREVDDYGYETAHPPLEGPLLASISADRTREVMEYLWNDIFEIPQPFSARIYITENDDFYHLYWAPTADELDYATPDSYDLATQLSFDLPHNVAHLAHLNALNPNEGAGRYFDKMAERAYFEAVAVLSERQILDSLMADITVGNNLAELFGISEDDLSTSDFAAWMIDDRKYEFKLRTARLYSDFLISQGCSFEETVGETSKKLGISSHDAGNEVRKYLPWTGLGSTYTHGYRKLLDSDVESVSEAILPDQKTARKTW